MRAAGIAIRWTSRVGPLLAVAVALPGGVACKQAEPPAAERLEKPPEKVELAWEEGPIPGVPRSGPVMIKQGPAPLLYLSEMAATLQVVDLGAGERVLAEAPVGPRSIVLVDTQRGIVFGGRTVVAGPLPARRRYAIYLVPQGESRSRTGVSQPVKRADPAGDAGRTDEPTGEPAEEAAEP
jgi:hypothetical protein